MSVFRSSGQLTRSDWIVAIAAIGAFLFYFAFMLIPVFQDQWSWETHGRDNLFVTGIVLAVLAAPMWRIHGETRKIFLLSLALATTALAFIGIALPVFVLAP